MRVEKDQIKLTNQAIQTCSWHEGKIKYSATPTLEPTNQQKILLSDYEKSQEWRVMFTELEGDHA